MSAFPDAWIAELLNKSDIVSIVSEYSMLKKKGGKLWCCCPFHSEKTPSFSVSPDKQLYYCFGCHVGGGVIKFVMDIESISYTDAVKNLARRAGMDLPSEIDDEKLRLERVIRERQAEACKESARFFHETLMNEEGAPALAYLKKRGVSYHAIRKFGLGFSPNGRTVLIDALKANGFSENELIGAGVAREKSDAGGGNRVYDAFYNRVMFPIIAVNNNVIGFGARAIGSEQPKYINTGETRIFNKRYNLFALNLVRKKRTEDIIVVEGYMDVIQLFSSGIENAVASLGTALTREQARLIKRYAQTVYIAYDGDSAGQNATIRGLEILAGEGLRVKVIVIPNEMDPDDFVKKFGKEAFLKLKDNALSLNAFKLLSITRTHDLSTEDGREEYALNACKLLSTLQPVEQARFYDEIARNAGISIETVKAQCALGTIGVNDNREELRLEYENGDNSEAISDKYLKTLIRCAVLSGVAAKIIFENSAELDLDSELLTLFTNLSNGREGKVDIRLILSDAEYSGKTQAIIANAAQEEESILDPEKTASDCVDRFRAYKLNLSLMKIAGRIDDHSATYDDYESLTRINAELSALKRKAYQ
ncbi:MAG: DNA primase [Clostridia bacterium]